MKTNSTFYALPALALALLLTISTTFGQAPKKLYTEIQYVKIKPGHTFAEARTFENEFKKVHQIQVDEGSILGWYMLALNMTTNPEKEYSYITVKTFSDPAYMDNAYPEAAMKKGWGDDYSQKMTDLMKQAREMGEVVKSEIWTQVDAAAVASPPSPDKTRVWTITSAKVKNGQYAEYTAKMKQLKPYVQERLNLGDGAIYNLAELAFPWASEKKYDVAWVVQMANRKTLIDDTNMEVAYKKSMPNLDRKQLLKDLNSLADVVRQEEYYLMEYAVKAPAPVQAKK